MSAGAADTSQVNPLVAAGVEPLPNRGPLMSVVRRELVAPPVRESIRLPAGGAPGSNASASTPPVLPPRRKSVVQMPALNEADTAAAPAVAAAAPPASPASAHGAVEWGTSGNGERKLSSAGSKSNLLEAAKATGRNVTDWLRRGKSKVRKRVGRKAGDKGKARDGSSPSPRAGEDETKAADAISTIGGVTAVKKNFTVRYDATAARYEGLPQEWQHYNKQFGVKLTDCPKNDAVGYKKAVPAVVALLAKQLLDRGGVDVKGIFRKAAEKTELDAVKEQINSGTYTAASDVHVLATLLKIWFRELPPNLLDDVKEQSMLRVVDGDPDEAPKFIESWKEHKSQLLLWLLDLQSLFVVNHSVNKMTAENMSIVWAPNLVSVDPGGDPMQALVRSRTTQQFLKTLLLWRLRTQHNFQEDM